METKSRKAAAGSQTKATGIVRKVDELGRIVLPIELRRTLEINEKDDLEIYVEGASIILRKYRPTCVFCNGAKNIITYKGKNICPRCLKGIKNLEITWKNTEPDPVWIGFGVLVLLASGYSFRQNLIQIRAVLHTVAGICFCPKQNT